MERRVYQPGRQLNIGQGSGGKLPYHSDINESLDIRHNFTTLCVFWRPNFQCPQNVSRSYYESCKPSLWVSWDCHTLSPWETYCYWRMYYPHICADQSRMWSDSHFHFWADVLNWDSDSDWISLHLGHTFQGPCWLPCNEILGARPDKIILKCLPYVGDNCATLW